MKNFTSTNRALFSRSFKTMLLIVGLIPGMGKTGRCQAVLDPSLPANKTICTGVNVTFSVSATGAGTITYQWQESIDGGLSWNNLVENATTGVNPASGVYTGTTSSVLTITRAPSTMNGNKYRSNVFVNGANMVSSAQATLNVGPDINLDDNSVTNCPATSTTLSTADAAGVSYQWQVSTNSGSSWSNVADGADPSGATYAGGATANLLINPLVVANDGYQYRYTANDGHGCIITSGVITQLVPALAVFTLPVAGLITANIGTNVNIPATVTAGTGPFKYQWQMAVGAGTFSNIATTNTAYSGATTSTLTIVNVTSTTYTLRFRVVIKNAGNCTTGSTAFTQIGSPVILPLMIESFTAEKHDNSLVSLSWKVNADFMVRTYTIQRSTDGTNFTDVGSVVGEPGKTSYTYTDPTAGTALLYRLKMDQQSDAISYSAIVCIAPGNATNFIELRPSLTTGTTTNLFTMMTRNEAVVVTVMDIAGRVQWSKFVRLGSGETYTPLDVSDLGKGLYYVRVSSYNGISRTLTFMKH